MTASPLQPELTIANFNAHLVEKARLARARYGPVLDAEAILAMLQDRSIVRYPVSLVFDKRPLQQHEFGWPRPLGFHPSDGFGLFIDCRFKYKVDTWPALIAYHIPSINYGPIVGREQAELFAATLLGQTTEQYYMNLCHIVDE